VKFYAWERKFSDTVAETREKEIKYMKRASAVKSVNLMTVFGIPPLLALGIFGTYVTLEGNLSSTVAFTTLSLFNTLRFPLVVLPRAVRGFAEAKAGAYSIKSRCLFRLDNMVFVL